MRKPYVGITGFMSSDEISVLASLMPRAYGRLLMVGVLASQKTLSGLPEQWPNRYPKVEDISTVFTNHPSVLNLIHYKTEEQETLIEQLNIMTKLGGINLNGFQLNVAWPSPDVLKKYRSEFPETNLVLQISNDALSVVEYLPEKLSEKVIEYAGVVDYLLLDASAGHAKPLETEMFREYLSVLKDSGVDSGLGVAGGLSKDSLNLVKPLVNQFPDLSIDAEGRLRSVEGYLSLELARDYLQEALEMFSIS